MVWSDVADIPYDTALLYRIFCRKKAQSADILLSGAGADVLYRDRDIFVVLFMAHCGQVVCGGMDTVSYFDTVLLHRDIPFQEQAEAG